MNKSRYTGMFAGIGALALSLFLFSCSGTSTDLSKILLLINRPIIKFSNFQNASVVIGQADFTSNTGGTTQLKFSNPYGNPAVSSTGVLYISDYGNNRVLGFNSLPTANNTAADFVLGQADFVTSDTGTGAGYTNGPADIGISNGKLFVLEYEQSGLLIWNSIPTVTHTSANIVAGRADINISTTGCTDALIQRSADGMFVVNGKIILSDTTNNRILIWNAIPASNGASANIVLGQGDFTHKTANDDDQNNAADATPSAKTLSKPGGVWSDGTRLIACDNGNHRVLIWNTFPTSSFAAADVVLGQASMTLSTSNNGNSGFGNNNNSSGLHITSNGTQLFISDAYNNRIMIWNSIPAANNAPADVVLGQGDFTHYTANDDDQNNAADATPSARTLDEPNGVFVTGDKLIVTDYNNNRVLIFRGN